MNRNIQILTLFILLGFLAKSAYSIKCYNCESKMNENCGDKFKAEDDNILDCSKAEAPRHITNRNVTGCMKLVTESHGVNYVKRSCLFGEPTDENYCQARYLGLYDKIISCMPCKKELCNGAGQQFTAIVTLTVFLSAIFGRILI